jgi:hypothetical protein
VVTKKISKPAPRGGRSAVATPRPRTHSLAPEHVGEAGGAALLGISILGLAIFIGSIAMIVSGVTIGNRFSQGTPPPNVGDLGRGQVFGGIGLMVLGIVLVTAALATLAEVRGSRTVTGLLSLGAALLSAVGVVLVMGQAAADAVLAAALAATTLVFAVAGIVLVRPRR